jgi:hypothetical protein
VGVVATALLVPVGLAAAAPVSPTTCFEQDNPKWNEMRVLADQMVREGQLSQEKADAYKCDPRLVVKDMPVEVTIERTASSLQVAAAAGCKDTGRIIAKIGSPVVMKAIQSLNWCYNGKDTVSDWSGQCTGEVTTWGKANFWNFDGCTTNDFIVYRLDGKPRGGIHHRTIMHFTSDVPWVVSQDKLISTWGHYDGTADFKVY